MGIAPDTENIIKIIIIVISALIILGLIVLGILDYQMAKNQYYIEQINKAQQLLALGYSIDVILRLDLPKKLREELLQLKEKEEKKKEEDFYNNG